MMAREYCVTGVAYTCKAGHARAAAPCRPGWVGLASAQHARARHRIERPHRLGGGLLLRRPRRRRRRRRQQHAGRLLRPGRRHALEPAAPRDARARGSRTSSSTSATARPCSRCSRASTFDLIVHCAAQPSHDLAARMPFDDFDVNAVGTLNLLEGAAAPPARGGLRLHEHQQGLRRRAQRAAARRAGDPLGLRRPEDCERHLRDLPDRPLPALALRRLQGGRRRHGAGVRPLLRPEGRRLPRRLPHRPAAQRRRAARLPLLPGEGGADRARPTGSSATRASRSATTSTAATCSRAIHRVLRGAAAGRGLQPRRRPREQLLDPRGRRPGRRAWRARGSRPSTSTTARSGDHICYISDLSKLKAHFPGWKIEISSAADRAGDHRQLAVARTRTQREVVLLELPGHGAPAHPLGGSARPRRQPSSLTRSSSKRAIARLRYASGLDAVTSPASSSRTMRPISPTSFVSTGRPAAR